MHPTSVVSGFAVSIGALMDSTIYIIDDSKLIAMWFRCNYYQTAITDTSKQLTTTTDSLIDTVPV